MKYNISILKDYKFYITLYLIIGLLVILFSNIMTKPQASIQSIRELGLQDIFYIFGNNLLFALFAFLLSFSGLSLILVFKIFVLIGQGPALAGIDSGIYYLSSFLHGFGELVIGCIIFCFTIKHIRILFSVYLGNNHKSILKVFYKKFFNYILPITMLIIFISSVLEVYVSNTIIVYLFK